MPFLRAIEKAIRRGTLRIIGRSGLQGPDDPLTAPLPERPRILLIRIDRIGDAIVSTPALHALRKRFPDGRIDVLLGVKNRAIAPLLGDVDNVHVFPKKFFAALRTIAGLRRVRYNAVVNLHLNRSASASLVSRLVGGDVVVESTTENAFVKSNGRFEHVVTMTARLLKPFGVGPIDETNEIDHPLSLRLPNEAIESGGKILRDLLPDRDDRPLVLINLSTTRLTREWLSEHVIALVDDIRDQRMVPMICGAPGDADLVARVATACGGIAVPPVGSYADFAAIAAQVNLVVTPDTSTIHLAAALGRPTVAFYASEQSACAWRPWVIRQRMFIVDEGTGTPRSSEVAFAVRQLLSSNAEHQTEHTEIPTRSV